MVLRSADQNTFIQHPYNTECIQHVYTTWKYITQIEKITRKGKLSFIEVIKGGTYIWTQLGFSLNSPTTLKGEKKRQQKNRLSYNHKNKGCTSQIH